MARVQGVPELLQAYSDDTAPSLDRVRSALGDYANAVASFNSAEPNDLGGVVADRSAEVLGVVEALAVLDRIPIAFAAALRELDAGFDPEAFAPGAVLHAAGGARLRRLLLDGVAGPGASGAERARAAAVLRLFDDVADAPAPLGATARAEDWRSATTQFTRHLGNGLLAAHDSRRLTAVRARHPVTRPWLDVTDLHPDVLARAGGTHNRTVLQAATRADDAATALARNTPLLPSLGIHLSPRLLTAGKLTSRAVGGIGIGLSALDGFQDYEEGDVGGVLSNTAAVGGSLLMLVGGPITVTVGAVLIVGSMVYEANREAIDAAARAAADRLERAASEVGKRFGF